MRDSMADALVSAASAHDLRRVVSLLARGADPNSRTAEGRTALYGAAGSPSVVRVLVGAGADPNLESTAPSEGLPICFVASWGDAAAVRALLDCGGDPNRCEDGGKGNSPLLWAAQGGYVETVEALLQAGADPDLATYGSTPLHLAAERGSLSVVRRLLAAGADPCIAAEDGRTALDIASGWADDGVEARLRRAAEPLAEEGVSVQLIRTKLEDGTESVVAEIPDRWYMERETGHAAIAELLRTTEPTDR